MTQPKSIKASVGFKRLSAGDVIARANAVLDGVYTAKHDYPSPPVDQATLKTQIDALSAGIAAGLDGGKKAVAQREHLKEVVIKSLRVPSEDALSKSTTSSQKTASSNWVLSWKSPYWKSSPHSCP